MMSLSFIYSRLRRLWLSLLLVFVATLSLYYFVFRFHENSTLEMAGSAQQVSSGLKAQLKVELQGLAKFTALWKLQENQKELNWKRSASAMRKALRNWSLIQWVSPSFETSWPLSFDNSYLDSPIEVPRVHRNQLSLERHLSKTSFLPYRNQRTGSNELLVYIPVYQGFKFAGFVMGILPLESLVNTALREGIHTPQRLVIYNDMQRLFSFSEEGKTTVEIRRSFLLLERQWTLEFEFAARSRWIWSVLYLFFLSVVAMAISGKLTFKWKSIGLGLFPTKILNKLRRRQPVTASSSAVDFYKELLELAQDRPNRNPWQTFSLKKIAGEVLTVLNPLFVQSRIQPNLEIEIGVPDRLVGDPQSIKHLMLWTVVKAVELATPGKLGIQILSFQMTEHEIGLQFEFTGQAKESAQLKNLPLSDAARKLATQWKGEWNASVEKGLVRLWFNGVWRLRQKSMPRVLVFKRKPKARQRNR